MKMSEAIKRVDEAISVKSVDIKLDKENMQKNMDAQAEADLKNLAKLSEEEKKALGKSLDMKVSAVLSKIDLTSQKIQEIYKQLSPTEQAQLEKVFEVAKIKNSAEEAKQREVNALIDLTKAELSELDKVATDAIYNKIDELFRQENYQQALDTAILFAKTNKVENKKNAYAWIMQILQSAPSHITLKIQETEIRPFQRKEWIKKMRENFDQLQRGEQKDIYQDASISKTDAFELDKTKSAKELSEKKAFKNASKELEKILRNLNAASALSFIEKKYAELRAANDVEAVLTKEYLKKAGYIPQNGKEIRDSELQAIKNLFYYKWNYKESVGKDNVAEKQVYEQVKTTKISGLTMAEVAQAKEILNQISTDPNTAMKVLLGDKNRDGKITNTALDPEKKREGLDQGTLFGGQVAQMYENAISRFGEESVVKNIVNIIKQLNGLSDFAITKNNAEELINAFKANPAALIAFRKKLLSEPDAGMSMLYSGTEYAKIKVDQIRETQKKSKEQQKLVKEFYEKNEELVAQFDTQIENKQKADLDQVRTNLQKFKESEDYKKFDPEKHQQIDAMIAQLSPDNLPGFLSSPQMKEARRGLILSGVGAAVSAVEYQGETNVGAGIGVAVTHEKINQWISGSKIFDSVSAGTGLYADASGLSLGIGLSVNGNKDLGKDTRLFYGVGVGTNILSPKGLGVNGVLGAEKLYNKSDLQQSLDKKSAKSLGVVGAAGVGIDLSGSDFDPSVISLALQGYWRQDKLDGIERQTESIQAQTEKIFGEVFGTDIAKEATRHLGTKIEINVDSITQKLQKIFPETRGETLYETAVAMMNTFSSYKEYYKEDIMVISELSKNFAKYLSQNWRNENIEKIVKEGWHISQVGAGVNLSLSKLFTGFFLTGSIAATKYEKAEYRENQESLQKAKEGMNDLNNFEVITTGKNLQEKIGTINRLLKTDCLSYNEQAKYITLDKSVFEEQSAISVMCHPKLAPYIHQEDGSIKLPFNTDISLGKILHQGKETRVLVLGARSMKGTKETNLNEQGQLAFLDQDQNNPVFGKEQLDKYNIEKKITSKEAEVQLNGNPSAELVAYLEQNGDVLVNFRLQAQAYKKFMAKMHDRNREETSLNEVKQLLPVALRDQVKSVDDVRFIYASLSRVSQTRDKQLLGEDLATKANGYLNAIRHLSLANKAILEKNIVKVKGGAALDDTEWSSMKSMLKIPNGWHYYNINTPEGKLFHMLTPIKKLAEARTSAYLSRVSQEYGAEGAKLLEITRNQSLANLAGKPTANGDIQAGVIGAVAGYESANEIDDKFVAAPKMVTGSLVDMAGDGLNGVKKHYLEELAKSDEAQFKYFKTQITNLLDKDTSEGVKLLRAAEEDNKAFIDAVLSAKTKDAKGTEVQLVNFDMKFGFFADCVNETILLGDVKVQTTVEEQVPASGDVYYYDAVVTNDAVTTAKTVGLGVVAGRIQDKGPKGSTNPEVPEGGRTEPLADLDQLNAENIKVVDGKNITIDGKTYTYELVEMPNGSDGVIVYSGNEVYQIFKENGSVTLYPLDENFNAILPQNAVPVASVPVISEGSSNRYDAKTQIAQLAHMHQAIASKKLKIRQKKSDS